MRNNQVLGYIDDLTIIKFFDTIIDGKFVEGEIRYIDGVFFEVGVTTLNTDTLPLTNLSLDLQGEILSRFGDFDEEL